MTYRQHLNKKYNGEIIGGEALIKLLGYTNANALIQADYQNRAPVTVFKINGRRGRFAFTKDVIDWLVSLRENIQDENIESFEGGRDLE